MANLSIRRKSGFIQRSGAMRRETLWFGGAETNTAVAGATAILLTSLNAAALALRPFTMVRTRGMIHVRSDQAIATESMALQYGHAVISDEAAAIGVTAIPTPSTNNDSDLWYVFETVLGSYFDNVDGSIQNFNTQSIESKAMRKVEGGQTIVSVVESSPASSVVSCRRSSAVW